MKKVIRLTESDLTRIVRRVISEETGQTLGGCITNYKTQNENWDAFKYVEKDEDDKFFLRKAYKKGFDKFEENRIALQRVQFITKDGVKTILSSYSLPNQQGLNITADFQNIIPYDKVKGNCSLIQKTLDDGLKTFISRTKTYS